MPFRETSICNYLHLFGTCAFSPGLLSTILWWLWPLLDTSILQEIRYGMIWVCTKQSGNASPCIQLGLIRQTHIKEGVCQGLLEGKPQHIKRLEQNRSKTVQGCLKVSEVLPIWSSWRINFSQFYAHCGCLTFKQLPVYCILLWYHRAAKRCSFSLSFWAALSFIFLVASMTSWVLLLPAFSFCSHATHMGGLCLKWHTTTLCIQKRSLSAKWTVRTIQATLFVVANYWKETTSCNQWRWSSWFLISMRRTLINQLQLCNA